MKTKFATAVRATAQEKSGGGQLEEWGERYCGNVTKLLATSRQGNGRQLATIGSNR